MTFGTGGFKGQFHFAVLLRVTIFQSVSLGDTCTSRICRVD